MLWCSMKRTVRLDCVWYQQWPKNVGSMEFHSYWRLKRPRTSISHCSPQSQTTSFLDLTKRMPKRSSATCLVPIRSERWSTSLSRWTDLRHCISVRETRDLHISHCRPESPIAIIRTSSYANKVINYNAIFWNFYRMTRESRTGVGRPWRQEAAVWSAFSV